MTSVRQTPNQCHSLSYHFVLIRIIWCVLGTVAQNKELSYTIDEEAPVPSLVGNVARDSNVSAILGSEVFATLRYRVLSQPDTNSELFSVGNTTGFLRTAARVDRESLCHFSVRCRLKVYVAIQQSTGPYFVTVKVNVYVRDINDNDPHFPQATMSVAIPENSANGISTDISPAMDVDVGENTIQGYDLLSEDPAIFSLEVKRNLDGSLVPKLVVNSQLDREAKGFYKVTILATDGGAQPRTGILSLNITVDDVNDNSPVFTADQYNVTVNETLIPRSIVANVTALDRDTGSNGEVRYGFSSRQMDDNANAFAINESTGEIRSTQDLTDLQGQTLRLVVEATDRGSEPLKAQAIVNVKVDDVVNNRPIIRLTTISGGNVSLVKESSQTGYVVAHFIVIDSDTGTNGHVVCTSNRGDFALQQLVENEYKITLFAQLDREVKDRYEVIVRCFDKGKPSLSASVPFSVIVEDVNDNPPVFTRNVYQKNVTEEQGPGILLRVVATDGDIGENGRVTYQLGNTTSFLSSLLTVMKTNGDIVALTSFDREIYKSLDFIVIAEDHGSQRLTSTTRVILNIIDINDRKPSLPSGYTLQVPENLPIDTVVGNITAIDEDEGESGRVAYHLLSDNNATQYFEVTPKGVVRTRATFDREDMEYYQLAILANDFGEPPNTNILSVTIRILDENDNPPRFLRPNQTFNVVNISTLTLSGSVIFRAKAEDTDFGANAQIDFSLAGDDHGAFTLNKTWGTLSTTRNLGARDVGTYRLLLVARDRGMKPRTSLVTLTVVVIAENVTMLASSQIDDDHLIIVVVLVCVTALTAACVTGILVRLRYSDRRDRNFSSAVSKCSALHMREVRGSSCSLDGDGVGCSLEKNSWGGYDAVKGQGVEETGTPELGRESDDDLILFKLQLAEQYKERDQYSLKSLSPSRQPLVKVSGKNAAHDISTSNNDISNQQNLSRLATFKVQQSLQRSNSPDSKQPSEKASDALDKLHPDELLSSSSRETTGTDSGRGCSEDDSQAPDSIRSETDSGFSSFLAMPVKDGWRHVGIGEETRSHWTTAKRVLDSKTSQSCNPPRTSTFGKDKPLSQTSMHQQSCMCSLNGKGQTQADPCRSPNCTLKTPKTSLQKRPNRSVTFNQHNPPQFRGQHPPPLTGVRSREARFQSSQPRSNSFLSEESNQQLPSGDYHSFYDDAPEEGRNYYVNMRSDSKPFYSNMSTLVAGRYDVQDSTNDSADTADEGNTTTTSGSYSIEQEEVTQEVHKDVFV